MWVSKWTISRWSPLSQLELKIDVIRAEAGVGKVNISSFSGFQQLIVTAGADVRRSSRHDIQLRIDDETYMFRARAADTASRFLHAMTVARSPEPSLTSSRDSDSISTASSGEDYRRRSFVPPQLAKSRRMISTAADTIYEEP